MLIKKLYYKSILKKSKNYKRYCFITEQHDIFT